MDGIRQEGVILQKLTADYASLAKHKSNRSKRKKVRYYLHEGRKKSKPTKKHVQTDHKGARFLEAKTTKLMTKFEGF
jgi:hypothetical protein